MEVVMLAVPVVVVVVAIAGSPEKAMAVVPVEVAWVQSPTCWVTQDATDFTGCC